MLCVVVVVDKGGAEEKGRESSNQLIPAKVSLKIAVTEQLYQAIRMIGGIGDRLPTQEPVLGTDPRTGSFRYASGRSMFWDFSSLHQKHQVGGTRGRVRRDGSDGWRSPVPLATILGVEVVYTLRQPSGVSPVDRSRTSRWLALWTVCEMAVPERSDGYTFLGRRQVASILLDRASCLVPILGFVLGLRFAATCCGSGTCAMTLRRP